MRSKDLVHLEILGPRDDLDGWIATLQSTGICHLADAMRGLEGVEGIARPAPTTDELESDVLRGEAFRWLQGVERVLPPAHTLKRDTGSHVQPQTIDWQPQTIDWQPQTIDWQPQTIDWQPQTIHWELGPGHMHRAAILSQQEEAEQIAKRLHASLESLKTAEASLESAEGLYAGFRALEKSGETSVGGHIFVLRGGRRAARALAKRFRKLGLLVARADGHRCHAVVVRSGAALPEEADRAAVAYGATNIVLPPDTKGVPLQAARERFQSMREEARAAERDARAGLATTVLEVGQRGRLLWSTLQDAQDRRSARNKLAATRHVVAARVFVPAEEEETLRRAIHDEHGDVVVVRPLDESTDAPTVVHRVAELPLSALVGLHPRAMGQHSVTAALATTAPLACGAAWSDVGAGVLLMALGALFWFSARRSSPRRDVGWMALSAGVVATIFGVCFGRVAGPAGQALLDGTWGTAPEAAIRHALGSAPGDVLNLDIVRGTGLFMGWIAFACAVWAGVCALTAFLKGRAAPARLRAALEYVTVAGVGWMVWQWPAIVSGSETAWWVVPWLVAPLSVLLWLDRGRHPLMRLTLEATVMIRLIAVVALSAWIADQGFAGLAAGNVWAWILAPVAVLVGLVACVADPAHVAMGLPYDVAFGARGLTRPFSPFQCATDASSSRRRETT